MELGSRLCGNDKGRVFGDSYQCDRGSPHPLNLLQRPLQRGSLGCGEIPASSDWLLPEFSIAMSIKVRSSQLSAAEAQAVHEEFKELASGGLRLAPVNRSAYLLAADMTQDYRYGLLAGDALHLAMAQEMSAQSIPTLDTLMARNAKRLEMGLVELP